MTPTILSLVPPAITISLALLTNRVTIALGGGVLSACFVGTHFVPHAALNLLIGRVYEQMTSPDKLFLYLFLATVGILITLLNHTGSAYAFAQNVRSYVTTRRGAQGFSILLSSILAVDDYLSILTTGHVMQPIADKAKISRLKLAFLVHSFATPIVILVPFSSWIGILTSNLENPGITTDPFTSYLLSIPFIFYSFIATICSLTIIIGNISFGPMAAHELDIPPAIDPKDTNSTNASSADLLVPLAVLLGGVLVGIPYSGGFWLFGGGHTFVAALQHAQNIERTLLLSALTALLSGIVIGLARKDLAPTELPSIALNGIQLMRDAIIMVFLAALLSGLLTDIVKTGEYLATTLMGSVPIIFLPILLFITALLNTVGTGSSWGTFGLLPPIAIPMTLSLLGITSPIAITDQPMILAIIGAIFSGAICGDHLSPFSETTIMTATSTQTSPIEHAKTQFFYMLPAVIGTIAAFVTLGLALRHLHAGMAAIASLCMGIMAMGAILCGFSHSRSAY